MKLNKIKNNLTLKYCKKLIVMLFGYTGKFSTLLKLPKLKKLITLEFYEDSIIAVLKFLIKRNPISPFYAFWKTLFVVKQWKSYKTYFKKFNKQFWTKHPFVSALGSFVFLILIISSTIYLTFLRNPNQTKAAWWDESWEYRKVLEIKNEKVAEDLTNFPVLISFTDQDLVAKTQSDGDDIVFTSTLNTKLSHEIESYDNTTGELVAWVKVPLVSSSEDTRIQMYYGNDSAGSQQDSENVWDDDYKLVQHLNEDPSGTAPQSIDSTSNSKDGTSYGTMTVDDLVDAKIGQGIDFDATNDSIEHGDLGIGNVYTMESWVKADTLSGSGDYSTYGYTIAASSFGGATTYPLWLTLHGSEVWYRSFEASPTGHRSTSGAGINTTDWFHITVTAIRGGTSRVYVNGAEELSFTNDADNNWTAGFTIGDLRPNRNIVFDGKIDEVRVSDVERSAGWIETSFNNQNDPGTFFESKLEQKWSGISWWNEGWNYRKIIEIDNTKVEDNLSDFPLLVSVTDLDLVSNAQADGDDIVFTTSIGKTKLAHEIESYNNTTGELIAWVKVPILSGEINTRIDMYYGNSNASSQQDSEEVWGGEYKVVHHLKDETSSSTVDSTSNGNDGTKTSIDNPLEADGKIGRAQDFDASGENIGFGTNPYLDANDVFSVSMWVNMDTFKSAENDKWITLKTLNAGGQSWYVFSYDNSSYRDVTFGVQGGSQKFSLGSPEAGEWKHVVWTFNGGNIQSTNDYSVYVNGVSSSVSAAGTIMANTSGNALGSTGSTFLDGKMDEVRVLKKEISATWVKTEYNNQNSPETFYSISSQQSSPGNPVAYWSFDEGVGSEVYDESGSGNNGTVSGATWVTEEGCVSGKCLYFDGDDDYVDMGDGTDLDMGEGDFTVSAWFKTSDLSVDQQIIIGNRGGSGNPGIDVGIGSGCKQRFYIMDGEDGSYFSGYSTEGDFCDGTWHHYTAVVVRDNNVNWYIDGRENGSRDISGENSSLDNIYNFVLGSLSVGSGGASFHGSIDEVKLYDHIRTADQIKQEYNSGTAGAKTRTGSSVSFGGKSEKWLSDGLVGHWKMDEASWNGTSDEVIDSSGNENHGVRVGDANTTNGKYGSGGTFDGDADYVNLNDNDEFSFGDGSGVNEPRTISFWTKTSDMTDAFFVGKQSEFYMAGNIGDRLVLILYGETGYIGAQTASSFLTPYENSWNHFSIVYDGGITDSSLVVYLNGEELSLSGIGSGDYNYAKNLTYPFQVGSYTVTASNHFNGEIDEVRFYNRALSKSEAQKLYHATPAPVLDLKLDEKEGSTAYDQSGYGNNATLYNSPTWTRGKFGSGVHFQDTTIDYLETPKSPSLNFSKAAGLTLESWVYLETASDGHNIMSGWDGDENMSGSAYWMIDNQNSQNYEIRNMVGGVATDRSVSTTWDMNRWYFLSYTYDGAKEILYRDGKVMGSWDQTGNIDYEDEVGVMIGTAIQRTRDFDGSLDGIKIYNYARTKAQILEDMNAGGLASESPVLNISFDEGYGGTAYDSSVFGNDGTLNNGGSGGNSTNAAMWDGNGKYGSAMEFDGVNDYVQITDNDSLDITDGITVSVWANPATASGFSTAFRTLLSKDIHNSQPYGFYWDSGQSELEFVLNNGSNRLTVNHDYSGNIGTWNHLVAWYDGDTIKIYANGELLGEKTYSVTLPTDSAPLRIGWDGDVTGDRYFVGKIDEVNVWNYALSETEIKKEFATSGRAMQMGGENRTATSGSTIKSGENAKYCVPGDTTNCDAPVLELDFDEKTGTTVYDKSGNGNDGTMTNMEASTDWVRGRQGGALDFDGNNDYINVGNDSSLDITGNSITLETWINPTVSGMGNGWVIWKSSSWWNDEGYGMRIGTSDRLEFYTRINSRVITSSTLQEDKWYHVVGTYDGARANLYINGVLDATNSYVTPIVTTSASVFIGSNSGEFFNGKIDGVRIYDYTRTPAQIAWDYNKGKPIAHWKFDEGTGTTVHDESGNENDGTMMNMDQETDWVAGRYNKSLSFDGDNDYVETNTSTDLGSDNGSASLWFKTATTDNGIQFLLGDRSPAASGEYLQAWLENGRMNARKTTGGSSRNLNSSVAVNDGNWHSLILLWGSDGFKLLIDGEVEDETTATTVGWNASQDMYFGIVEMYPTSSYYYEGELDDVKFFNYTLNEEQIRNELNNGAALKFN